MFRHARSSGQIPAHFGQYFDANIIFACLRLSHIFLLKMLMKQKMYVIVMQTKISAKHNYFLPSDNLHLIGLVLQSCKKDWV